MDSSHGLVTPTQLLLLIPPMSLVACRTNSPLACSELARDDPILDPGGEVQERENLRHPRPCDPQPPRRIGVALQLPGLDEPIQVVRERQLAGQAGGGRAAPVQPRIRALPRQPESDLRSVHGVPPSPSARHRIPEGRN